MITNLDRKLKLSMDKLVRVELEYQTQRKSMLTAFLLWAIIGEFGAHRFYLKQKKSAIVMLVIGLIGFISFRILNSDVMSQMNVLMKYDLLTAENLKLIEYSKTALYLSSLLLVMTIWVTIDLIGLYKKVRKMNEEIEASIIDACTEESSDERFDEKKQFLFDQAVREYAKPKGAGYLMWLGLGAYGGHRFFYGRRKSGMTIAISMFVGAILMGAGVIGSCNLLYAHPEMDAPPASFYVMMTGLIVVGVLFIIMLIDLALIWKWARKDKAKLEANLHAQLEAATAE